MFYTFTNQQIFIQLLFKEQRELIEKLHSANQSSRDDLPNLKNNIQNLVFYLNIDHNINMKCITV